jgi:hypothetical protein
VASTMPILNDAGLACHNRISALVRSNLFDPLACRGHGSLRGRCQIASSWFMGGSDAAM